MAGAVAGPAGGGGRGGAATACAAPFKRAGPTGSPPRGPTRPARAAPGRAACPPGPSSPGGTRRRWRLSVCAGPEGATRGHGGRAPASRHQWHPPRTAPGSPRAARSRPAPAPATGTGGTVRPRPRCATWPCGASFAGVVLPSAHTRPLPLSPVPSLTPPRPLPCASLAPLRVWGAPRDDVSEQAPSHLSVRERDAVPAVDPAFDAHCERRLSSAPRFGL